ncbi:unnamed protein product [Protopolystoma xenopodis]|uniref:TANC1/2-like winged helix domain-containing protein n=1 Tax=Protopolystoma xenopodis TaxID=117903 RepID=A0A3S5CKV6_9PLAT|nr:unnamed protein product [Protopolystoma xenopodis]
MQPSLRKHLNSEIGLRAIKLLQFKCNACILYVEKILDALAEQWITVQELSSIPENLNGLYGWLCQRVFSDRMMKSSHGLRQLECNVSFTDVRPIFNMILASPWPLTCTELYSALNYYEPSLSKKHFFERIDILSKLFFLNLCSNYKDNGSHDVLILHQSFADWLLDVKYCTQSYLCSIPEGHAILAFSMQRNISKATKPEDVRKFAYHVAQSRNALPNLRSHHILLWLLHSGANISFLPPLPISLEKPIKNNSKNADNAIDDHPIKLYSSPKHIVEQEKSNSMSLENINVASENTSNLITKHLGGLNNEITLSKDLNNEFQIGLDFDATQLLILSARKGSRDVVKELLSRNADSNGIDSEGWSALRSASWAGHCGEFLRKRLRLC